MNCSTDVVCEGRRVCSANGTCTCLSSGYVGPTCQTPHASLYVDTVVLFVVMALWGLMCAVLARDLYHFWRFRVFLSHVTSSFGSTVVLVLSTLLGFVWVVVDVFCTLDLSTPLVVVYGQYKACSAALASTVSFSLCLLFGYTAMLNVLIDWLRFLSSANGTGNNNQIAARLPLFDRLVRISQSVYAFGLLAFLVSLRFDLLVIWNLPFVLGLIVSYCVLGQTLIRMLHLAESTIARQNRRVGGATGPSNDSSGQTPPIRGAPAPPSAPPLPLPTPSPGLGRQMTSPGDQSSTASVSATPQAGPAMARQMTSPGDAPTVTSSSSSMEHARPQASTARTRRDRPPPLAPPALPSSDDQRGGGTSVLLRRTMRRIQATSMLVSCWLFVGIVCAVLAFLTISPRTSFQYERGGWMRPGYWLFRCAMVCVTFVCLALVWYVHANNQGFTRRMVETIRQARAMNNAGDKEHVPIDTFLASVEGTTLGRAEGSTVVAIQTIDDGSTVDGQLLNRGDRWRATSPATTDNGTTAAPMTMGTRRTSNTVTFVEHGDPLQAAGGPQHWG